MSNPNELECSATQATFETPKVIDKLIPDIYELLESRHSFNEENLNSFLTNMRELLITRLNEDPRVYELRMSKIGTRNRKAWYEANAEKAGVVPEVITGQTKLKFLYGDILEQLLILLAKEANHTVSREQAEIEIEGVKGHLDCVIDGTVVDVKSASSFAFKKFKLGTLFEDDPFGYIAQISGYAHAEGTKDAAILAINKENAELTLLKIHEIDQIDPPSRIKELKEVVKLPEPPVEKCYEPVPLGKGGNLKLNTNCSYCPFKHKCWADANGGKGIRTFQYATKPEELVVVMETPRVPEIVGGETLTIEKETFDV